MLRKDRTALIALIAAALLVPPATVAEGRKKKRVDHAATVAQAAADCAHADVEPTAENLPQVRAAILCLHNRIRSEHRLPDLRENRRLRRAALGHSRDMVRARYFEHTTPRGVTMVDRILRTRYVRPSGGWALGENLAWGTGSFATPRGAVQAWMESPGHRANVLKRAYRELGVGVVIGVPVSDATGATYTVDFGVRR